MFFKYTIEDAGLNKKDKRMFSNKKYTCVNLYKDEKGRPVTIMKRKEASPMPYMIQYGFASVFFKTQDEAEAFCAGRFTGVEE